MIMAGRGHHQRANGSSRTTARVHLDPWNLDPELRHHIENCPCSCDHMGYGNFLDYQSYQQQDLPVRETSFGLAPHYFNNVIHQHHHYHNRYIDDYEYQPSPFDSCSCSSDTDDSDSSRSNLRGPWCVCFVVCVIVATLGAGLGIPLALNPQYDLKTPEERLQAVYRVLKEAPLIDGHNDLPWNLRKFVHNKLGGLNLSSIADKEPWSLSKWSHTDIPRLKAGLLGAQFWSAYVPCKSQHLDAVQITLEQIDVIRRLVELNTQHFALVLTADGIKETHRKGKISSLIGVEGGHALGNSLAILRTFYNLGARYLTITHSCDTPWAKGSNSKNKQGLSPFGLSVIKEMNRLGMIIDLSHTSVNTAKAALNASKAPVIFSHSCAFSLCNSTRNVPDDILRMVADNGGVVMVRVMMELI
nr:dipeptidase 1-like isoform X2 [Onthophagus taurus]